MAKLALFALTFTALIAFSAVSAYRTTITTNTVQDNDIIAIWDSLDNPQEQCRSQVSIKQLNHCQMHLTQGIMNPRRPFQKEQQHLQQCCSQLKQVNPQCQCDAIQQVLTQARQQSGLQTVPQIESKAQRLTNDCGLEVQHCQLAVPMVEF
ncbi:putative bifunctional inhibitor/plant lipid transfer protein/seed storage helical [Helianthus annuus]|uniref:Bifunctional inhibitor/plant lipid transfer protein/seed storage helical n=1 Tax=Helianthus annuus TaxID=4232 RepID=A0A076E8E8_HELAN|nr:2S seed storage protein-like [Helianthus annuus]AII01835.1 PawS-like preproalbumin 1 [Helianthus annuus]KAF5773884.1 putative bifunctional inhibitor/plant lipid transfer protein/seed storage helical [Helianthus annuus]KAJ0477316.1 putative AAI/SS protein [Helianthus annuus]KAJ0481733.1 putative bifunctional inhibitor/plant lipid transfer protein/seed storage helical [Helianthus annuus]KAJ0498149.1 putative AAI/SS protein [Helianthus annuus]